MTEAITIQNRPARRRRRIVIGTAVGLVLLLAGVAAAAYLARARITGGGTAGQVTLNWIQEQPTVVSKSGAVTVTAALEGPQAESPIRIDFANALPGDAFTIQARVRSDSSTPLTVNPPKFVDSPFVTTTFGPASALQTGQVIPTGPQLIMVQIRVTFADNLAPGTALPAAADAGITASTA